MRKTDAFRRAAALLAALSITVSLAAPAFAETYYYIDDGDITITKDENGQTVKQGNKEAENIGADEEIIITTHKEAAATLESDLEGPAAEDTGFGPVVEDNYQPAAPAQPEDADQPEGADQQKDADQPEGADQQESADQPKDADQQEDADQQKDADQQEGADQQAQPQQAAPAPAAAPAASTPVNPKKDGFWGNTITVINNFANTVLNLTLKDVKIDVSNDYDFNDGKAALSVQGDGNVTIELDGKNELKSGYGRAGLEKNTSKGTLTLKDDKEPGSLKAEGGTGAAGIGGGGWSSGSGNITVSGAAQVTAVAGKGQKLNASGSGATIGDGYHDEGTYDEDGNWFPGSGKEVQADINGLTTGHIYHEVYNEDGSLKREWWEFARPKPTPDGPNAPAEESNEVDLGTPVLHVETLEGDPLPFNAQQQGSTLRVTSDTLAARLHGTRQALEALREQGVEQIQFVTSFKTTTLSVEELLAEGGSWFALEHNGLVSRQLSAAQAESLKCRMR